MTGPNRRKAWAKCCTVGCGNTANVVVLAPEENILLLVCFTCEIRAKQHGYATRSLPERKKR